LIEPDPKPGRSETVAVRGAGRQFVGIGAHEEASRHSTLRTDRGLRRTVKMRTAFAAFPPHAFPSLQSFGFCVSGFALDGGQAARTVICRGRAFSTFGSSSRRTPSVS